MCKRILCFLFFLIAAFLPPVNAQETNTSCIVRGRVKNQTGTPITGASIQLVDASDTTRIQDVLTVADGGFEI